MATKSKEKAIALTKKEDTKKWSQETRKGNTTECIDVEKLANKGFLVVLHKSVDDPKKGYQSYCKKLYSETNPLEDMEEESPMSKLFTELLKD